MAHHKRRRPKHRRAGCLLCKPSKLTANKKSERARAARAWRRHEANGRGIERIEDGSRHGYGV